MGLYDNYELANSRLVKQYAGSALNEMAGVGQELQKRYDFAKESDDILGSSIDSAKVFEGDQGLFNETIGKYRNSIAERAKSGNYEDMVRSVRTDARHFANDYKPFADNYQRIQQWYADVDKALEDKRLLSPETAQKLKQYGMYNYKGLQRDKETGQLSGYFSGPGIAREIDVPQKIDEWMKSVAPRITGGSVERIEGDYYVTRGGKRTRLTDKEIQSVINSAMSLDPEWQSYAKQKVALDTMGLEKYTPELFEENSPVRKAAQELAASRGIGFGQALKELQTERIAQGLLGNIYQYAHKYERNDVESNYSLDGMTETAKKRLDDLVEPLGFTVNARLQAGAQTMGEVLQQKDGLNRSINRMGQQWQADSRNYRKVESPMGIRGEGDKFYRYFDQEGNDITPEVQLRQNQMNAMKHTRDQLVKMDKQARKIAGLDDNAPELKEAQEHGDFLRTVWSGITAGVNAVNPGFASISRNIGEASAKRGEQNSLMNSEAGRRYLDALKSLGGDGSALINIKRTTSASLNKAMEEQMGALVANLDGEDLKGGYIGLQYGSGSQMFENLRAEDYGKLKGNPQYSGYFVDPNTGGLKVMYKFPGENGEQAISVITNAPTGLVSHLLKANEPDMANLAIAQALGVFGVEGSPAKRTTIPLDDGEVEVRRTSPEERSRTGKMYMMEIPSKSGIVQRPAGSITEITSVLKHLQH